MKIFDGVVLSFAFFAIAGCSGNGGTGTTTGQTSGGGANGATTSASGTGSGASGGGGAGGSGGSSAMPLGNVTADTVVDCASVPNANMLPQGGALKCRDLTVACPGTDPIVAHVAVLEPGGTPAGTIYLHDGGGGTSFFNHQITPKYAMAGFRLVFVDWATDWEQMTTPGAPGNIKTAACRPATVMKWAYGGPHGGTHQSPFCAQGQSGGSAAVGYSLANYGMEDYLDYAALTQGPPFGKMDCGCDPSAKGCQSPPPLCPLLQTPALQLPPKVAGWEGVSSCDGSALPPGELTKLAADSVAADGGDFDYPKTGMSAWFCAMNPNGTTGGGAYYLARVSAAGAAPNVYCSPNCSVESIYQQGATLDDGVTLVLNAMRDAMVNGCKPHHL